MQGLGNDFVEVARIKAAIERYGSQFLNRVFTSDEQSYCFEHKDPAPRFAGRWAAKEAVAKALGTGLGAKLSWKDIEILNDEQGKPEAHLTPTAKARFKNPKLFIAISHSDEYAMAVAVWA